MSNTTSDFSIGAVKRYLELWFSSEKMRQTLLFEPLSLEAQFGALPPSTEMRLITSPQLEDSDQSLPPYLVAYLNWQREKALWRDKVKEECSPKNEKFASWRNRQIRRGMNENGSEAEKFIIHTPLAFEFAQGCSVGCWYCGCDAPPLESVLEYNDQNVGLFRDILDICIDNFGDATKWGCSYWASDPLDNPNYEKFMVEFHGKTGEFPQTTTALPDADLVRTKRLLALSSELGTRINRFSIQSMKMLENVHRYFSADELTDVELVLQNNESFNAKANAGRFFEKAKKTPKLLDKEKRKVSYIDIGDEAAEEKSVKETLLAGTNSCMSGFWVNLVQKSIKLVSPTRGCEKWPKGYIQFDEVTFTDSLDFKAKIEWLIEKHMPSTPQSLTSVQFARSLHKYQTTQSGFAVSNALRKLEFSNDYFGEAMELIGRMVRKGENTVDEIAMIASLQCGIPERQAKSVMQQLFDLGVLFEEPSFDMTAVS